MKLTSFKQQVTVHTTPTAIYDVLMDSRKHAALTGAGATIGPRVGDAFAVYDGYAYGTNLELIQDALIAQSWRANEEKWPEDHFSEVRFVLKAIGKGRTRIVLHHRNVPAALADNFKKGWHDFYWVPLKRMFPAR
jgi:activator of HSP90 ATPase